MHIYIRVFKYKIGYIYNREYNILRFSNNKQIKNKQAYIDIGLCLLLILRTMACWIGFWFCGVVGLTAAGLT